MECAGPEEEVRTSMLGRLLEIQAGAGMICYLTSRRYFTFRFDGGSILIYSTQSENYTDDVDAEFSHELYVNPDPNTHGTDGYIHVSYPQYFYNQSSKCPSFGT